MIFPNVMSILLLAAVTIGMFLIVPPKRIRVLFPIGLIFGLAFAFILLHYMQNIFGFWLFQKVDVLYMKNIPVFLSAAWLPAVITFAHLVQQFSGFGHIVATILLFAGGATIIHFALSFNDMLTYVNWTFVETLLISAVIHTVIALYMYGAGLIGQLERARLQ